MTKSIALLSGKGGSGKTTIALSMASLLSECKIRCLLIDCDFSTNGATYFYENKLDEKKYISFYEIMTDSNKKSELIKINDFLSFLPSVSALENLDLSSCTFDDTDCIRINSLIKSESENFDVLLFDCQAGYTKLLKQFLPNMDEILFVMEADAISSSSIRNLHLKIGESIKGNKAFQIFNKATPDEYEVYNKISGGTFFTNIETVLFDWKIRKAFSLSEIPDMERTSARYGQQILSICNILLKDDFYKKKLISFENKLKMNFAIEEKESLKEKLDSIVNEKQADKIKRRKIITVISMFVGFISLITLLFYMIDKKNLLNSLFMHNTDFLFLSLCIVFTISAILAMLVLIIKDDKRFSSINEIENIKMKLFALDNQIEEYKRNNSSKEEGVEKK